MQKNVNDYFSAYKYVKIMSTLRAANLVIFKVGKCIWKPLTKSNLPLMPSNQPSDSIAITGILCKMDLLTLQKRPQYGNVSRSLFAGFVMEDEK